MVGEKRKLISDYVSRFSITLLFQHNSAKKAIQVLRVHRYFVESRGSVDSRVLRTMANSLVFKLSIESACPLLVVCCTHFDFERQLTVVE